MIYLPKQPPRLHLNNSATQEKEGWGADVIPRLARDIANDLPEMKGFSERNIDRMVAFAHEYPSLNLFVPQPAALLAKLGADAFSATPLAKSGSSEIVQTLSAQSAAPVERVNLQQLVAQLPWAHNVLLLQKVKDLRARLWYVQQTITHG